jgi:hypothetical protein
MYMPPSKDKKRVELALLPEIIEKYKAEAAKEGRSIKNLMERVLIDHITRKKL